ESRPLPLIPILVNTYYPPNQPTAKRCIDFGRSVARAIKAWKGSERVAVAASGGVSHFVIDEAFDNRVLDAIKRRDLDALAAAPGGPTDAPGRIAAQILTAKFPQPAIVENRPGAGGALGARAVATAPADGYTLLVGNTSVLAVIPAVSSSAGYDPRKDLMPVT